jgi:N-carbamoyl-L-amino-acid hydrolase
MKIVPSNIPVDGARLWADLMALAAITDPDRPYTRRSFSALFLDGRSWLKRRFEEAGLDVRLDAGGNLFGRLEGDDPAAGTIMLGSHSDTVPSGGRFDGIAGVVTALEVLRSLRDAGKTLRHAIEVVDFLAEEPSEHGLSCVGSRAMAGALAPEMLDYRDGKGERLGDAIQRVGGSIDNLATVRRADIAAFFELHIEQGVVLESRGIDLGIVTGIVGIARVEVIFEGRADHAGATPMILRRDAGVAAAQAIAFASQRAVAIASSTGGHFVATAGVVEITPNASNVVPGTARVVFDIRGEDQALVHQFVAELDGQTSAIASAARVERRVWNLLSDARPSGFDPYLRELLTQSAGALGFSALSMPSGAGHDAAFVARFAPSAMVFVPCREGRSHTPEEWAEPEAIAAGAATIYEAVLRFDAAAAAPGKDKEH